MLTVSGSFDYDSGRDPAVLLAHIAEELRRVKGRDIAIAGNTLHFRGGMFRFFVTNWNLLNPFGFGSITVDPARAQVRYELSVRQTFAIATAFVALTSVVMGRELWRQPFLLVVLALAWAFCVTSNLGVGIPRFNSFLRHAIDSAPAAPPASAAAKDP